MIPDDVLSQYLADLERRMMGGGRTEWFEIVLWGDVSMYVTREERYAFLRGIHFLQNHLRQGMEGKQCIILENG